MNWLLERFYSWRPWVRVSFVLILVLGISLGGVVLSMFQYSWCIRELVNSPSPTDPTKPLFEQSHLRNDLRTRDFLEACERLDNIASPSMLASDVPLLGKLSEGQKMLVRESIASMAATPLEDLLTLAVRSSSEGNLFQLGRFRTRMRFLASWTVEIRRTDPTLALLPIVRAMESNILLTEYCSTTLISKMVSVAGAKITASMLYEILSQSEITASEAVDLLAVLNRTDRLKPTFAEMMRMEYRFMRGFYHDLYYRAPAGSWLLEKVFGDPMPQFENWVSEEGSVNFAEVISWAKPWNTHLFLLVMVPNVERARLRVREVDALREILRTMLTRLAGGSHPGLDPFSQKPLLESTASGTFLYSVGNNGFDEKGGGDDVHFGKNL